MLSRSYRRKFYNVDSADREAGSPVESFIASLDMPYDNKWNTCTLLRCEIDKTYYMLSDQRLDATVNSFPVTAGVTGATTGTVQLTPNANYSTEQLREELEDELQAIEPNFNVYFNFEITNFSTGKYLITNSIPFSIDLTNAPLIAQYLGFTPGIQTAVLDGGIYELISTQQANLQRYQSITISSNMAINNNTSELAFIFPTSSSFGSVISYQNSFQSFFASVAAGDVESNYFKFSITETSTGKPIILNGGNWRMLISLSQEGL